MKARFIYSALISLFLSQSVAAQISAVENLEKNIPEGYTLVEMPAVFETTHEPVLFKANEKVIIPPKYKTSRENGVIIRREISPERHSDRVIVNPLELQLEKRLNILFATS